MSHHIVSQCTARVNRSEQAVPGSNPTFMEKAAKGSADVVFLDLEDAVAPDEKEKARKNVIEALQELDWSGKTVSVRINGLDTQYMYRDVIDVMEQAGDKLDLIMIPKAGTASDIYMVDALVNQIEIAKGYEKRIGFEMIIETALGMQNVHRIASASTRNESLHFGVADYAASTQARTINIGGPNPDYSVLTHADEDGNVEYHWGDMWHYAVARMVVAARANGLRAIDGPYGDIKNIDGFSSQARMSAVLGCEGARGPRCGDARWPTDRSRFDPTGRSHGSKGRSDRLERIAVNPQPRSGAQRTLWRETKTESENGSRSTLPVHSGTHPCAPACVASSFATDGRPPRRELSRVQQAAARGFEEAVQDRGRTGVDLSVERNGCMGGHATQHARSWGSRARVSIRDVQPSLGRHV